MFGFNVEGPTSLGAIDQYIGGYATPEAAETDTFFNAPRGYDYLTKQYQALTGDAFANPFEDASNSRAKAMTEAAMNGASVATGSNTGMKLLSLPKPDAPLAVQADNTVANANARHTTPMPVPVNLEGTPLSPGGKREVANSLFTSMLQSRGNQFQMAGREMQLPAPQANDYLKILDKRVAAAGVADLHSEIYRNNPELFSSQSNDDPRFARVQGGKEGKVDAADVLHPVAFDPRFKEAARRDPAKAAAYYAAITNGRDYKTDVEAKSQLLGEQKDARKKIIESIKNVEADPVSGDLYKVVETKDIAGNIQQQRVPLNPMDKAAIEAEGGFKRIYGVDLPNRGGLPPLEGMTTQEHADYRTRTQAFMKQGMSVQEASKMAHRQMYQEQQQKIATLQPSDDRRPGVVKAGDALGRFMGQTVNATAIPLINNITEGANKVFFDPLRAFGMNMPHAAQIPPLPIPSEQKLAQGYEEMPSIADIWREGNKYWNERLPLTATR